MTVFEVADKLVSHCRQGDFKGAGEALWADDVVSIEPMTGEMARLSGKANVAAKGEWFVNAHDIHSVEVPEPVFFYGDTFIVRFLMDLTEKATGTRRQLDELGVYQVKDGKIVSETFYVPKAYFGG
jgi:hypothetical protein